MQTSEDKILKKIFRFIKYHKIFILVTILLCIFIVYFVFSEKGLISRAKLEKENKELINQINQDSLEGLKLDKEINELKTSEKKLEQVAREKYKMSKRNERIFQIKEDSAK